MNVRPLHMYKEDIRLELKRMGFVGPSSSEIVRKHLDMVYQCHDDGILPDVAANQIYSFFMSKSQKMPDKQNFTSGPRCVKLVKS